MHALFYYCYNKQFTCTFPLFFGGFFGKKNRDSFNFIWALGLSSSLILEVLGVQRCDEVYDTVLMPSTGGARTQCVAPLKLSQKSLFFFFFFFFFCQINIWCDQKRLVYDKTRWKINMINQTPWVWTERPGQEEILSCDMSTASSYLHGFI